MRGRWGGTPAPAASVPVLCSGREGAGSEPGFVLGRGLFGY